MKELIIIGGGGHSKVVLEAVKDYKVAGFLDDNESIFQVGEVLRIGKISDFEKYKETHLFHIAIGNNKVRKEIGDKVETVTIIHSTAYISPSAQISKGSFIGINTVVNSNSKIGKNCIINTGAIVEHDCIIGDYSHLSYKSLVGAGTEVCEGYYLDMNKIIERGQKIE